MKEKRMEGLTQMVHRHTGESFEGWKIPGYGEAPPEAMVDWLGQFQPECWEGDDSGIVVWCYDEQLNGGPGDWVVFNKDQEVLTIVLAKELEHFVVQEVA